MQTHIFKKGLAIVVLVALFAGVTACSGTGNSETSSIPIASFSETTKDFMLTPEANVTVRVAFFPNITHAQALVGQARKTFSAAVGNENTIAWKQFNAGSAEVEALFAEELDIGYIGPGPAINAFVKSNGDFLIIAGATNGGSVLVSRTDLVIEDLKKLDGLKVAVPQVGNTQDLSLRKILSENGLSDISKGGSVQIVSAENPDILALMKAGEIDAALVPEPWGSRLIKEAGANLVLDYNEIWRDGDYTSAVIIASKEFIANHPWIVQQFLSAHIDLTKYIGSNLSESKMIVNEQIKTLTGQSLSQEILDSAFDRLTITTDPVADSLSGFAEMSYNAGFLYDKPDLSNFFSLDILNRTLSEKS